VGWIAAHCAGAITLAAVGAGLAAPVAQAGSLQTYVVLYRQQALPAAAQQDVAAAGGQAVASYADIGVVIAKSSSSAFPAQIKKDGRVSGVSATSGFATQLKTREPDPTAEADSGDLPSLADRQWDMRQIQAVQAHEVTEGRRSVLVGDIDTGLDFTHLNLRRNVDFANSASCVGGTPNRAPSAWMDDNGHGTHTAGTIAAGGLEGGMTGVAPDVRIAAIKTGDANGFFFPEAVVCAFMWAGTHHMDVTNNSYFADPWLYNCLNDPGQRAIWDAETRAIRFAMRKGVTVVAAAGNENDDLANLTVDTISPDFPADAAVTRKVDKNCFSIPAMVPGVYTVSADGNKRLKSFYSSFGLGFIKSTAPGGDSRFQVTAEAPNGRVLSTFPASQINGIPVSRRVTICGEDGCATYAYLQGTSMASPHVAGVAALIASRFGHQSPAEMTARLNRATDPFACPANPFNPTILGQNGQPALCVGSPSFNSFYGHGQINALKAVTSGEEND
jgi:subtilisin family serine protease